MSRIGMVILFVGILCLVSTAGIIGLAINDQAIPDVLQNVAVASLTGLVGLLVPAGDPGGNP